MRESGYLLVGSKMTEANVSAVIDFDHRTTETQYITLRFEANVICDVRSSRMISCSNSNLFRGRCATNIHCKIREALR